MDADEFFAAPAGTKRSKRLPALLLSLVLVLAGVAVFTLRSPETAEAVVFTYGFEQGDRRTYGLTMDMTMTPDGVPGAEQMDVKMSMTMDWVVSSKAEDGTTIVDLTMSGLTVEPAIPGGIPPGASSVRLWVAPDGQIKKAEGVGGLFSMGGADAGSMFGAQGSGNPSDCATNQGFFPTFPAEAIAPGASWDETYSCPIPFGDQDVKVTAHGEHLGFDDSPYGSAARIGYDLSMPMDLTFSFADMLAASGESLGVVPPEVRDVKIVFSGNTRIDTESLVLPSTGEMVQMDATGDMSMTMKVEGAPDGAFGPVDEFSFDIALTMSLVRVDAGSSDGVAT